MRVVRKGAAGRFVWNRGHLLLNTGLNQFSVQRDSFVCSNFDKSRIHDGPMISFSSLSDSFSARLHDCSANRKEMT